MAVKTPNTKQEQDSAYNPGEQHARELTEGAHDKIPGYDRSADGLDDHPVSGGDVAKEGEESPQSLGSINYQPGGGAAGGGLSGFIAKVQGINFKKAGPSAGIAGLLIGGFGLGGALLAPGIAVVHIAEQMNEDLNDQLAAMDVRSERSLHAMLKDLGTKKPFLCKIKVKCGFKGMTKRQAAKFAAAGVEVKFREGAGDNGFRRYPVESVSMRDSKGVMRTATNINQLDRLLRTDLEINKAIKRGKRIKLLGFFDRKFDQVLKRHKTNKSDKIRGDTEKKKWATTMDNANHGLDGSDRSGATTAGSKAKSAFRNMASFVSLAGVLDGFCEVGRVAANVQTAAKLIRARALFRFAMDFLTLSSQIKDGSATPDDVEMVGNRLTAVDTREMIKGDNSTIGEDDELKSVKNPDYMRSAFDSSGYKTAAYNDAPTLSSRSMKYSVGGAFMGVFAGVGKAGSTTFCKFFENKLVQAGFILGGLWPGASQGIKGLAKIAGKQLLYTAAGMLAIKVLTAYLTDIKSRNVITEDTKGVEAGDAMFAGSGIVQGRTAMSRGMKPQENVSEIREYQKLASEVKSEYVALEVEDAQKTPFDIMNQYSFLGSFARKVVPVVNTAKLSASSAVTAIPSFFSLAASSLTTDAGAVTSGTITKFNPDRFTKCVDSAYEDIGIDSADVFCNVRYGMSEKELDMDTDEVISYMHDEKNCYRPSNDPTSNGEGGPYFEQPPEWVWVPTNCVDDDGNPRWQYSWWLDECTRRVVGWGEWGQIEHVRQGKECLQDPAYDSYGDSPPTPLLSNFRVFTMDQSIIEGMEYSGPNSDTGSTSGNVNSGGGGGGGSNGSGSGSSGNGSSNGSGSGSSNGTCSPGGDGWNAMIGCGGGGHTPNTNDGWDDGSSPSGGGFRWPLGQAHANANPGLYRRAHTAGTGTAWGGNSMGTSGKGAGIAIDIGMPVGKPVYAMFTGVVTSTSLCGSGDGIAIKSKVSGGTLGVAYMHGINQKYNVGDTVQAGKMIMQTGAIGCTVRGAHLHIGMAYNGKYVCPQDVFLTKGNNIDWKALVKKGVPTCGR